jgi:hypothetical protein
MNAVLLGEVERQLLADLEHYEVTSEELRFDWSECCQEGHCTRVLGGELEDQSSVCVVSGSGEPIAEGWMDFIHGGGTNPLFVFWLFLRVRRNGQWVKVKSDNTVPRHIWANLPAESKALCAKSGEYDARWSNDPIVRKWASEQ